jgi:hypothetical protein
MASDMFGLVQDSRTDWDRVAASLSSRQASKLQADVNRALMETGLYARTLMHFFTSGGGGGPKAVTGTYQRSWFVYLMNMEGVPSILFGTAAPQAHRLEKGFYGNDSSGRFYSQGARPHLAPVMALTKVEMEARLARVVRRYTSWSR